MSNKKIEKGNPILTFLFFMIALPFYLTYAFLKLLIGIPIGLFAGLVQYSKKHY